MHGAQKILGVAVLIVFALSVGYMVCFAFVHPVLMTDCQDQRSIASLCPFMSVSIPTVVEASFGGQTSLRLVFTVVLIVAGMLLASNHRDIAVLERYRCGPERVPISFLNFVARLIAQGILHSRVFGL